MTAGSSVRSGGQDLFVVREGEGPRLALLHGGPGLDHRVVDPLARAWSWAFEVWRPDLPGHGRSAGDDGARLPDLRSVFDRTTQWLAGLDPDVLVGHSLGAWLAREAVRRGRLRPRASVWIAPPAGSGAGRRSAVRNRAEAVDPPPRGDLAADVARREFLAFAELETAGPLSDAFREAVERCRMRPPWAYGALLRQLHRSLLRATPVCRPERPVLIVCGALDRTTPPPHARAVADATPGADLVIVPDEGHLPGSGASDGVARAVLDWLERKGVSRRSGG